MPEHASSSFDHSAKAASQPMTGAEYLESLRDEREVWIHGKRVEDVTVHPAFRNSARMIARLYDSLHDPVQRDGLTTVTDTGSGGRTHRFFVASRSWQDQLAARDAAAAWARMTYGWMGRSPDYKGSIMATLGPNADFYGPFKENARAWYRKAQERVLYLNHALINPPMDRDRPPHERGETCVHVEKETDQGLVVSGAKVVATGSAVTNATFVGFHSFLPNQDKRYACIFIVPMNARGVKLICRTSYEHAAAVMGSPFDYPLSSRMDENDAIFILDRVLIPWENVLLNGDVEAANNFSLGSGFFPRALLHGCTRLAVKLEFIAGLLMRAMEAGGTKDFRGQQVRLGELITYRNLFWSLSEAMARNATPWVGGAVLPDAGAVSAYQVLASTVYSSIRLLIEQSLASGLIYLNSSARDFLNPELRPLLDKYVRGSNGYGAEDRVKVLKLLWDAVGTEFGSRHELYEVNYAGGMEESRLISVKLAELTGLTGSMKSMVDACLAEYDLKGWKVKDMVPPDDVSINGPLRR